MAAAISLFFDAQLNAAYRVSLPDPGAELEVGGGGKHPPGRVNALSLTCPQISPESKKKKTKK